MTSLDAELRFFRYVFRSALTSNQFFFEQTIYKMSSLNWVWRPTPVNAVLRRQANSWKFVASLGYIVRFYLNKRTTRRRQEKLANSFPWQKPEHNTPYIHGGVLGDEVTMWQPVSCLTLAISPEGVCSPSLLGCSCPWHCKHQSFVLSFPRTRWICARLSSNDSLWNHTLDHTVLIGDP